MYLKLHNCFWLLFYVKLRTCFFECSVITYFFQDNIGLVLIQNLWEDKFIF
jgi:hypothetical protein